MPSCSRCPGHPEMKIKGTRWECMTCGFTRLTPILMPSYMELLRQNTELRKQVEELTQNSTRMHQIKI